MKNKWTYILVSVFIMISLVWGLFRLDIFQPSIASKILRFHVLANSDSVRDQHLKLEVRNVVGAYLGPLLESADSIEETKEVIAMQEEKILELAKATLQKNGCDAKVRASVKTVDFPEKTYGAYTFPAGKYEALQIVIGEGEGQNWWCVLYPNMCFRGSVYEVVDENAKEMLREILSPWEYAEVFESPRVEIRSKLLEYFKD